MARPTNPDPSENSHSHYRAPEFALLALHGAAIAALTAFWDAIKGDNALIFGVAFIIFSLGVIVSVYAAYCRFCDSPPVFPWNGFHIGVGWIIIFLFFGLVLIIITFFIDKSYPVLATVGRIIGIASLLLLPVFLRFKAPEWNRRLYVGGTLVSFALFVAGVIVAIGTLTDSQINAPKERPGTAVAGGEGGTTKGDAVQAAGRAGEGGQAGNSSTQITVRAGGRAPGQVHHWTSNISMHLFCLEPQAAAPPQIVERIIERSCPPDTRPCPRCRRSGPTDPAPDSDGELG